jgi:hypothetical protein
MTDAATTPELATPRPGPMMLLALFLALTRRDAPRDGDGATAVACS